MVEFRRAVPADLDLLLRVEAACFKDPWDEDMLATEIATPHSTYMLMFEDDRFVGYYSYMHILDEVHILNVAVLPDSQGRGLGRQMMRHLVEHVPEDTRAITLEVRVGNTRARRLYESMGFVCVGVRPGYYLDKEDAAIYWRTEGA